MAVWAYIGTTPANTIQRSVRGDDASFCQITLTNCLATYRVGQKSKLLSLSKYVNKGEKIGM